MIESSNKHKLGHQKPIHINISFNINQNKLKELPKTTHLQKSFHEKEKLPEDDLNVELKTRNQFYRQEKLSEFTNQDHKKTSQQIQPFKKSQQDSRRKKSKRGLSDFSLNQTEVLLGYQNQLQNLIKTHRRGNTTSFSKRQHSSQTINRKKVLSQEQQKVIREKNKFSQLKTKKVDMKKTDFQKSLKQTISKIITSQWSKKSFQLSTQKRKSNKIFSAELTANNLTGLKFKKKKSSKSETLKRQNNSSSKKKSFSNSEQRLAYEENLVLQKLSNFKSIENSLMVTELDFDEEYENHLNLKCGKINPRNKIYIKTDQSEGCIDQIHQFQRQKFHNQFFQEKDQIDYIILPQNDWQTHKIIQNFIKNYSQNQNPHQINNINDFDEQQPEISLQIRQTHNQNTFDRNSLYSPQSNKTQLLSLSSIKLNQIIQISNSKISVEDDQQSLIFNKQKINKNLTKQFGKNTQEFVQQTFTHNEFSQTVSKNNEKNHLISDSLQHFRQQQEKIAFLLHYLGLSIDKKPSKQVLQRIYQILEQFERFSSTQNVQKGFENNESQNFSEENKSKYVQFQQYSFLNKSITENKSIFPSDQANAKVKMIKNKCVVADEVIEFKDDYGSQKSYQEMVSMNLETIEKALDIRLKTLEEKKQKQLSKLEQNYHDFKINQSQYAQTKNKIQKWFKTQIKQILSAKKSIAKGYHQAKKIVSNNWKEKSEKTNFVQLEKTNSSNLSCEKNLKMMKCLSESVLKKKKSSQNQNQHLNADKKKIKSSKKQNKIINRIVKQKPLKNQQNDENKQKIQTTLANENQQQNELNEVQRIDLFGSQREKQFSQYQNSPKLFKYQNNQKQLSSESSFSSLSENSFIENKISTISNDQYDYQEQKSNQKFQKTNQSLNVEQITPQKISKSKKVPTQQNTENQFIEVFDEVTKSKDQINTKITNKLKNLNQEDLQDIFQFIFLDLCIEIYQDPCHQDKIMDCVNKFITKSYEMSKRKKGIKTNINVVKDYLKRFCGYLLRTNKKTLSNLNTPMGPTALEMLKYMHQIEQFENQQYQESENIVTLIIPISIFDNFQRALLPTIQFEVYYDDEEKQKQRTHFLKNVLHIHNKAIYDALNEFLDHQRPYGIWGKPFPWKKATSFSHLYTEIDQQQKLRKSAEKVIESCSYVCGLMVDKQQSLLAHAKVSQAYVEQIKEDRISRMLANEMVENEERWLFYDDEETEVLVEIGFDVFNKLLDQFIGQFNLISKISIEM